MCCFIELHKPKITNARKYGKSTPNPPTNRRGYKYTVSGQRLFLILVLWTYEGPEASGNELRGISLNFSEYLRGPGKLSEYIYLSNKESF